MKKGGWWPIAITLVLASTVAANFTVMRIAGSDPSFAVEPDYYKKAVAHDSTMEQQRQNLALGWTAYATVTRNEAGSLQLIVALTDSAGAAIRDATVSAVAMYIARAANPDSLALAGDGTGRYIGNLNGIHAGQWEVRVIANQGGSRFTSVLRAESPGALPPSHRQ